MFYILHGLPSVYDVFKTSIRTRSKLIFIDELVSLLCSESIHIDSHSKVNHHSDLAVAYPANVSGHKASTSQTSGFRGSAPMYRGQYSSRTGFRGGRSNYRGSGGRNFGKCGSKPFYSSASSSGTSTFASGGVMICQICTKLDHTTWECWHHLNSSYQPPTFTPVSLTSSHSHPKAFATSTSSPPSTNCVGTRPENPLQGQIGCAPF